jgi:2-C-methyl-D-erythritol 4-phosphate cytidylyltransferase
VFGKPIIIYTLEKFEDCNEIDKVVVSCNASWLDYMKNLIDKYSLSKVEAVVAGGKDRQSSIECGLNFIRKNGGEADDIIVIHDGVRPLVEGNVISENIRVAKEYGSAMTVKAVVESVIITDSEDVVFDDFKKRDDTYSLTSPQTFKLELLEKTFEEVRDKEQPIPLLDAALAYTYLGNDIHIVRENNQNIKITTPEDYYILKAMLELEENKYVFGL